MSSSKNRMNLEMWKQVQYLLHKKAKHPIQEGPGCHHTVKVEKEALNKRLEKESIAT
jgi:hypothetical protein